VVKGTCIYLPPQSAEREKPSSRSGGFRRPGWHAPQNAIPRTPPGGAHGFRPGALNPITSAKHTSSQVCKHSPQIKVLERSIPDFTTMSSYMIMRAHTEMWSTARGRGSRAPAARTRTPSRSFWRRAAVGGGSPSQATQCRVGAAPASASARSSRPAHQRAPAERAELPGDPKMDRREVLQGQPTLQVRCRRPPSRPPAEGGKGGGAGKSDGEAWFNARFMTRISSDEAPCRPTGATFHSNWPDCDWELVFGPRPAPAAGGHRKLGRAWWEEARPPHATEHPSMRWSSSTLSSTAGRVMASRQR
jgi:hypothetical protein